MSLTEIVSGMWSKVKRSLKTTLAVAPLVAMCYAGPARADPSVDISEEGDYPNQQDLIQDGTNYIWNFKVMNNGPNNNYDLTQVILKNVYSSTQPTLDYPGWTLSTDTGISNLWNLTVSPAGPFVIAAGLSIVFPITTTIPSTTDVIKIGTLYGQGLTQIYDWQPTNPPAGDDFYGPIGIKSYFDLIALAVTNGLGSISPATNNVLEGSNAVFNIAASNHYTIASISTNGSSIGSIPSGATNYVFVWSNVVANGNISADFIIDSNKVNVVTNGNGIIAPGSLYLPFGGSTNFVLTADIGNHISDIKTNNASIGGSFGDQSRTFSWTNDLPNRTNEFTLEAVFQINSNLVTASAGPNGTIVPAGSLYLPYGSSTNFVITPDEHYDVNVKSNGTSLGAITLFSWTNNFTNQANSLTLEALFSPKAYPVTLITPTNGTFNPATDFQAYYGTTTGVTVAANAGYHIKDIFTNNASIGGTFGPGVTNYNLSWTMGTNALIQALFALNPPTLNSTNIQFEALVNQIKTWWTPGDGSNRLVVAGTNNINWSPVDGLEYIATNPAGLFFDNKVVYNGSGTNFTLLGLATNTMYYFKIFEYNGAGSETIYLTNGIPAEANKSTLPASDLPRGTIFTFH